MVSSCFRQVEFVGVLKGTPHAKEAHELVDFMLGAAAGMLIGSTLTR